MLTPPTPHLQKGLLEWLCRVGCWYRGSGLAELGGTSEPLGPVMNVTDVEMTTLGSPEHPCLLPLRSHLASVMAEWELRCPDSQARALSPARL